MIVFRNLTKTYHVRGRRKTVASNTNVIFPTGISVGLLGRKIYAAQDHCGGN